MARVSTIPEDIRKHVPMKSCKVRNDNGVYRVYKYRAVKLKSGKWGTDCGTLIGKIIPGQGFLPNARYLREFQLSAEGHELPDDTITDVAYGQYDLLMSMSSDVHDRLKRFFDAERAAQIYCYSLILCANGFVYMDKVDDYYQESFLSLMFRGFSFRMGYSALSGLLHDLGMRGNPVRRFEQSLIDDSSKDIAIDGHVIRSCSENNDLALAEPGYKLNMLKAPQENLLIAYDIKTRIPVMYQTFRGSSVDKRSVVDFLESRKFKGIKFVVDRGFYSERALGLMSRDGNCYIIPLPANTQLFRRVKEGLEYDSGEFVYRPGKRECSRIVYHEEAVDGPRRVIVYKDIDENNAKRKSYKIMMDQGEGGYIQEKYDQYCDWWGVYFLETTAPGSAQEIFCDYKNRWSIETYNNYVKNDAGFNNLKIQDYYVDHGFDFIMLVTGILYSKLNEKVREIGKSGISTFDLLLKAGHMRMVLTGDRWKLRNTRTRDIDLLALAGFTPRCDYMVEA